MSRAYNWVFAVRTATEEAGGVLGHPVAEPDIVFVDYTAVDSSNATSNVPAVSGKPTIQKSKKKKQLI